MILIDSNIPMYLVGSPHPLRDAAARIVAAALARSERLVTDAEVIQEILHRYVAIRRKDAIQPALDVLLAMSDEVLPVRGTDALRAKELVLAYDALSARDAIHAAVMEAHGIAQILTFDAGFDVVPNITRVR